MTRRGSAQDSATGPAPSLAWQMERVMQGNNDTVWALLTVLRQKHPRAKLACQSELVVVDGAGRPCAV